MNINKDKKYVLKYLSLISILLLHIFIFACNDKIQSEDIPTPKIRLKVIRVIDKRFPEVDSKNLKVLLNSAKDTLKMKFGIENIEFEDEGIIKIQDFFRMNLKPDKNLERWFKQKRYDIYNPSKMEHLKPGMVNYLQNWKLDDLKIFLPDNAKDKVKSYEDLIEAMIPFYDARISELKKIKLDNGGYLINKNYALYQSFCYWQLLMYTQDKYDIVITNGIIINDDFGKPAVHSLLHNAMIGGFAIHNIKREYGRVTLWSMFKSITKIDYFRKTRGFDADEELTYKINGAFGLAHEIGHMLFFIPDFYDEELGCLMNTNQETLNYLEGYKILMESKPSCEKELEYVNARLSEFRGDIYYDKKLYKEAIEEYQKVLDNMPQFNEAPPNYFLKLHYRLFECYSKTGDDEKAEYYFEKYLSK